MFVVRKGWVANVLTQEIVGFDSSYEFQFPVNELSLLAVCYDPASSLCKRNDVQGKGWLDFNSLSLTNGVARADSEDNVSGAWASGPKG